MTERLKKRLELMEQKTNPTHKGNFDLVAHIAAINLEAERLMELSEFEYEKEISSNPHSEANKVARVGVSYQKRFNAMTTEDQKIEDGCWLQQ
jgi:hypothetical protein